MAKQSKPSNDKVVCETPTAGKKPTRIDRWKFDLLRSTILKLLPKQGEGIAFKDLPEMVERVLDKEQLEKLGSVPWYVTTVKLHLEVTGEIRRVPRSAPQRLLRC